jgi:hypothetical protein
MRDQGAKEKEFERGQASAEFLAALPAALLIAAVGFQLLLTGHAAWMAGNAARVGARAGAVGADSRAAVRGALPSYLREGLAVKSDDGHVRLRVRVPLLVLGVRTPLEVGASAAMERTDS